MKKILALTALSFLALAPYALAQSGFVPLAPIPGLTDAANTSVVNSTTLANFFNNLYKYIIGLAAAIAVVQIIWAGIDIAYFHKDAVSAITDDKGKIYNAIIGLVLVLSPVLVFSIINPAILNLSLALPELKTASGPPVQPAQGPCESGPNCTNTGGVLTTGDKFYPCSGGDCTSANASCAKATPDQYTALTSIVCVRPDGTIDPKGSTATGGSFLGGTHISACVSGEALSVSCAYSNVSSTGG